MRCRECTFPELVRINSTMQAPLSQCLSKSVQETFRLTTCLACMNTANKEQYLSSLFIIDFTIQSIFAPAIAQADTESWSPPTQVPS